MRTYSVTCQKSRFPVAWIILSKLFKNTLSSVLLRCLIAPIIRIILSQVIMKYFSCQASKGECEEKEKANFDYFEIKRKFTWLFTRRGLGAPGWEPAGTIECIRTILAGSAIFVLGALERALVLSLDLSILHQTGCR